MSNIRHGYYGTSEYPSMGMNRLSQSIYCISDELKGDVMVFPLTIGCFSDLYKVIEDCLYRGGNVKVIPMSIKYDYFSDIYNAVTTFNRIYSDLPQRVQWVFPAIPLEYTSEEFETSQIRCATLCNSADSSIITTFYKSGIDDLYDIIVESNGYRRYFSQYMTMEKLNNLIDDNTIDEIHMCGNESRHGGICAMNLTPNSTRYSKVRLFNFSNIESIQYLSKNFIIGHLKERWVLL